MDFVQLRNDALQAGLNFCRSRSCKLPKPFVIDGHYIESIDCLNGDIRFIDGGVVNSSQLRSNTLIDLYRYMLTVLSTNKNQSV